MTGIAVFAHGSTIEAANEPVRRLAAETGARGGFDFAEAAFLDCARPDLREAVGTMARAGALRVIVVPFFLTLGVHLQRDLPRIVAELRDAYPGVTIEVAAPLEGHPALAGAVLERAEEVLHGGSRSEGQTG